MASDYENIRLVLTGYDRANEWRTVRVEIDQLWPRLWEIARLSDEKLVWPGETELDGVQAAALLDAIGLDADLATTAFYVGMERVAGANEPVVPMRLLAYRAGGTTRTSCDPGLWEPVYYPPAEGPPASVLKRPVRRARPSG
jgi:hypothetical protein